MEHSLYPLPPTRFLKAITPPLILTAEISTVAFLPDALATTSSSSPIILIIPPIASFCYQLDGIFIGASQTSDMRNATIFASIAFIILSIYSTKYFGNHGIWLSLLMFMLLRSLSLTFLIDKITKRL